MNERYINESCNICGKIFINIEDIMVDLDTDNYVCKNCAEQYDLNYSQCLDYTEDEEGI